MRQHQVASPRAIPPELEIDAAAAADLLVDFLRRETRRAGFSRGIVGLSGGIDSAVSAALACRAFGASRVLCVLMPHRTSSPGSLRDARAIARRLKAPTETIDITPMVDAYFRRARGASPLRRGNRMARERMAVLYDLSLRDRGLVIGTSNKTELLLGYGTLHGDMASALNPLGDLYKTQVWRLSEAIGVPESVIRKQPSADLFQGQTDEADLGFGYAEVDRLLYLMVDQRYSTGELESAGFAPPFIRRVSEMVRASQFKRRLPVIAKVSHRTIDRDFRYARDWGT
jgi:NAD+ synthase